ncbi:cation diffusion facilitator family transporter [Desulfobotulus sp.]|jgi:cation diffusion facilitator family transporter|uniref:cation diffusion facilitator family transporter n=1 Tax=Desulfobotulus sp. TaxID=1940337 RepID=UPI002A35DB31|nr:cation diffusion facilitator family transporter [Desulfobotulus sp.]MDY0164326.1 cation diffusion facilitator family transporter [Desulfobotulus sp.]
MSQDSFRRIRSVTLIGLLVNLILVAVKYSAGWWGNSEALMADAVHSATDAITDLAVIAGAAIWTRPPDADHPYGHHRMETLVTLFIGGLLFLAGIGIGVEATQNLLSGHRCQPLPLAAYAAAFSIFIKEGLYRWTHQVGHSLGSPAVIANAWHHRIDALSSIPAFLAVSAAILFPKLLFLDSIGALVVAVFIAQAATRILWPNLRELMATGASPEICRRIADQACAHPAVLDAHHIRTRFLGTRIFADIHLVVDGDLTVREAHKIAEDVRKLLMRYNSHMEDVVIHIEPPDPITPPHHPLNRKGDVP